MTDLLNFILKISLITLSNQGFTILLILLLSLSSKKLIAQNPFSNSERLINLIYSESDAHYELDSMLLVPSTIEIINKPADSESVQFELLNGEVKFLNLEVLGFEKGDTLEISYRVLPINKDLKFQHLDERLSSTKDKAIYIGYDYKAEPVNQKLINEAGIDYDGSFSRGFSLGNNQSLLLNSNFNMQMAGDLGDGIQIKAAISDDNIPIQPEGNTRLLQEFDKVYINVGKNGSSITAGDYELNRPKSYFVNYFKQVQGLSAYYTQNENENKGLKSRTSFAVSRSIFNRFQLEAVEGNQGPYKLPGKNGERFIIIEAGSEKIYEDGKLLTRGQNHDYVISYDRAEIIFTEKKLITKDSRIIVEFEYVDRSYLRTMYATESSYTLGKIEFKLNYYSQQDSKNISADSQLDSTDVALLQNSGDDLNLARRSGIRLLDPDSDPSIIRYKLIEDSILIYSTNIDSALYVANFSEVAFGEGDYIIDPAANANGRVYKYEGPGLGNYIPEIQLVAPQKNQILSLGTIYRPTENTEISTEVALSYNDLNRFSDLDGNDNQGTAAYFKFKHDFIKGKNKELVLSPYVNIEIAQENFKALNPYRAPEFTRDWNLSNDILKSDERFINTGIDFKSKKRGKLKYQLGQLERGNIFSGIKHDLDYNLEILGFQLTSRSSFLQTDNAEEETSFSRPILGISRKIGGQKFWRIGYVYEAEKNERIFKNSQLANPLSAAFRVHRYFVESPEYKKFNLGLAYEDRIDQAIVDEDFITFAQARDITLNGKWNPTNKSLLNVDFVFRDLSITDNDLAEDRNLKAKRSYLGQIDYNFEAWSGFLRSSSSFNIGSGQQTKVEFDYQEVQPGEGNYDWVDINMDGIQQLVEFRLSEFQDTSRYIQVPLFNNEFIQTNNSGINQSVRLNFRNLISAKAKREKKKKEAAEKAKKSGKDLTKKENQEEIKKHDSLPNNKKKAKRKKINWLNQLGRISTNSTIRINKKVEIEDIDYNPLNFSIEDTTIVNFSSFINHTIFINRGKPQWDFQLGYKENQAKISQVSSNELRSIRENFARIRLGLRKNLDFIFALAQGEKEGETEAFGFENLSLARNFDINSISYNPELNFRPSSNLRFISKYKYLEKSQSINLLETMVSHDFSLATTIRTANKSSWDASVSYVNVNFNGDDLNSFVALELLEGLKNGDNFLWRSAFTRRLANNVDLIINYEGRKTGDNTPIHTARAQVKATF